MAPDELPVSWRSQAVPPIGGEETSTKEVSPFSSYMEQAEGILPPGTSFAAPESIAPSPLDMMRAESGRLLTQGPSLDVLAQQLSSSEHLMVNIKEQLGLLDEMQQKSPQAGLTQSQKNLLDTKLSDANSRLYAATAKLGLENEEPPAPNTSGGMFEKFLSYLTDGQQRITDARKGLAEMGNKKESFNPADFLNLQSKLNMAQQELEYSSVLLSKAVEGIKMLFQVQI